MSEDFSFDVTNPETISALYEIPFRYNLANQIAEGDKERGDPRKPLLVLQKKFRAFLEELEKQGGDYFNLEVSQGAKLSGDLDPNLQPDDYPNKNFSKKYCYWFEFERYLKFFDLGLADEIEKSKPIGGRPRNEGLHLAVLYIADFWVYNLGRKYTFDEHQGEGVTDAFHFTQKLIKKIENVTDAQIKTAMRSEISDRRRLEKTIDINNLM